MSGDRTQPLAGLVSPSPREFGVGTLVRITQFDVGPRGNVVRTLGFGRLLAVPEPAARLEIGLRNDRGLISSPVAAVEVLAPGYLAAVTGGRVYLLQRTDAEEAPAAEARRAAEALLTRASRNDADPDAYTTYARLKTTASEGELAAFCETAVQVTRRRGDGEPEVVGVGEILSDPQTGEPLRFSLDVGGVLATTDVLGLSVNGPVLEVRTANSTYWFECTPQRPAERVRLDR